MNLDWRHDIFDDFNPNLLLYYNYLFNSFTNILIHQHMHLIQSI